MRCAILLGVVLYFSIILPYGHTFGNLDALMPATRAFQRQTRTWSATRSNSVSLQRHRDPSSKIRLGKSPSTECPPQVCARAERIIHVLSRRFVHDIRIDTVVGRAPGRRETRSGSVIALRSSKWQDQGQYSNTSTVLDDVHVYEASHVAVPFARISTEVQLVMHPPVITSKRTTN